MKTKLLRRLSVAIIALMLITTSVSSAFAVFVTDSKKNIVVTSGKVEIVAEVDAWEMHSHENINMTTFEGTKVDVTEAGSFLTGGTASIEEGTVILDKIVPGDGVSFNINVYNNSDVAIKYRAVISEVTVLDDSNANLADILDITIDGKEYVGQTKEDYVDKQQGEIGLIDTIPVAIDLPVNAGIEWVNKSVSLSITVEAVQANIYVPEGVTTLEELKSEVQSGKGATAEDALVISGGSWKHVGSPKGSDSLANLYVIINDGEFGETGYSIGYSKGATITINGGSFSGEFLAFQADRVTININGGNFDINNFVYADSGEWTISITAGTFSIQPLEEYIVDGYIAKDNGNGTWTVIAE